MKKISMLIVAIAALSMFFVSVSIANVPPEGTGNDDGTVNQIIGFDDVEFDSKSVDDCRACHPGSPDKHHMLYGSDMPEGECSKNTGFCVEDDTIECAPLCNSRGEQCMDAVCPGAGECSPIVKAVCNSDDECSIGIDICSSEGNMCDPAEGCRRSSYVCDDVSYCNRGSAAVADPNEGVYGCFSCHVQDVDNSTGTPVNNFLIERNCQECHTRNPHHNLENQSKNNAGNCTSCHGDIVDNMDDNETISTYTPSLVTPATHEEAGVCSNDGSACHEDEDCALAVPNTCDNMIGICQDNATCASDADCDNATGEADCADIEGTCSNDGAVCEDDDDCQPTCENIVNVPGGCAYCHNEGTDIVSGVEVNETRDTHHGTDVYKDRFGSNIYLDEDMNNDGEVADGGERLCAWCHPDGDYHADDLSLAFRTCQRCHGKESLHNIQADSDGSGTIVIGGEDYGWGHVGADNPGDGSDCWGCHGFGMASASAPGAAIIAPTIDAVTPAVVTPKAWTFVNVTGNAFTNDAYTANIELTPISGGDVIVITPARIDVSSIIAAVGKVPVGSYDLRAVKDGVKSGAVSFTVKPATTIAISNVAPSCGDCDGTAVITGSGFGDAPPAGAEEYLNVMQGDVVLTIVSWTDTEIVVSGDDTICDGTPITINALMGSATK